MHCRATDNFRSNIKPIRILAQDADHRAHKGLNNAIEVSHSLPVSGLRANHEMRPTHKREKIFGKFKSHQQAQRFLAAQDHILIAASSSCRAVDQLDLPSTPLSIQRIFILPRPLRRLQPMGRLHRRIDCLIYP